MNRDLLLEARPTLVKIARRYMPSGRIFCFILFGIGLTFRPAIAGHYELVKGAGTRVCEAYKKNFEPRKDAEPMACERHYDPMIKGFASPHWRKLDPIVRFDLYKKATTYLWQDSLSPEDLKFATEHLTGRVENAHVGLFVSRLDLDGDGKYTNVLAVRELRCGPEPRPDMKITRLYALNDEMTDIDVRHQMSWDDWYNNATVNIYKGHVYFEHYEPEDNWGHLFSGVGTLSVLEELPESASAASNQEIASEPELRLSAVCEIKFIPSNEATK